MIERLSHASRAARPGSHTAGAAPMNAGRFLGLPLSLVTKDELVEWVVERAQRAEPSTAFAINANSVNLSFEHPAYREALASCDAVYCDGISVLFGARLLGEHVPEKLTTTDLLPPIAARCAEEGLTMYILGNEQGIAREASRRLRAQHRGLRIVGARSGFFDSSEEEEIIDEIRSLAPHLLWVGMGNPRQELWVMSQRERLGVPVTLTCGAMMEIVAGALGRPPAWVTDNGFEWLYRLVTQPRRTWRRYLIGNVRFTQRLLRAAIRKR